MLVRCSTPLRRSIPAILSTATRSISSILLPSLRLRPSFSPRSHRPLSTTPLPTTSFASPSSLTAYFDLPSSSESSSSSSSSPTGLFQQPLLTSPSGLRSISSHVTQHAQLLLKRIHKAPKSQSELQKVVKNFDRLSDKLCGVIDMCESIWTSHPDDDWKQEAGRVYEELCRVMNEMNVDQELYNALLLATETPSISSNFTPEEAQTASVLLHDFQKSGIHLPPASRALFVDLSEKVIGLGRQFSTNIASPPSSALKAMTVNFADAEVLKPGLGESFVRRVRSGRRGGAIVQAGSWEGMTVLRKAEDEESRRRLWKAGQGGGEVAGERVGVLEELLGTRAKLAGLVGRGSWGEVELENKMAKNPAHVTQFLTSLASSNLPSSLSEISLLAALKQSHLSLPSPPSLQPWDRDFYLRRHASTSTIKPLPPLSPYFSVGTILNGLSTLFKSLYGISLVPSPAAPGETWHPSVRKLEVVDEIEGVVGYVYCDLFSREGKAGNAAHYTVRCSRRVDDDDVEGDLDLLEKTLGEGNWGTGGIWGGGSSGNGAGGGGLFGGGVSKAGFDPRVGGLQVKEVKAKGREGSFQLPIAVLNCDFELPTYQSGPTLLNYQEVETIFHEMGHAMHSMLGRTSLHNVSGTRVPTDLAELPSILMESFCSSSSILPLLLTHHQTGLPPAPELLEAHKLQRASFPALENSTQIHMALLDQHLHSVHPQDAEKFDSTRINKELTNGMGIFPFVEGTAPQILFGHLFGYGASYYSYLFDRAIAGRVWEEVFQSGEGVGKGVGLEGLRDGGERLKGELLMWGGGRDPWEMVAGVLKDEQLRSGDGGAMKKVGEWGVGGK
ncbi:hypothetical protein BDY24DRAFT_394286 [Mrakia frigida]|uniref:metalloendopeptidase n=1 Tax=Mrakia frigida TaxID=29902 RepID=UPI003FCC1FAE